MRGNCKTCKLIVLFFLVFQNPIAQQVIKLYPGAIPNSKPYPMKEISLDQQGMFDSLFNQGSHDIITFFIRMYTILGVFGF